MKNEYSHAYHELHYNSCSLCFRKQYLQYDQLCNTGSLFASGFVHIPDKKTEENSSFRMQQNKNELMHDAQTFL